MTISEERRIVTKRLHERPDDSWTIDGALASGAYETLRAVLAKGDAADVQEQVKLSGLRGRGGANFSTGQKWSFLPADLFPRYLVVNGDEGEPSTFKDRMLVERDPHQLVEGIIISAFAIQCNQAFVYLRGEFALGYDRLTGALDDARAKGFLGKDILGSGFDLEIVVHRGAGAYICGEETALIESLEGERGMPRLKPPFPAIAGLYAKPTVVNNVETLSTVPHIVTMGGAAYAELGVNKSTGTRVVAISGHVRKPGNYEIEFGCTFRDVIYGFAGGIRDGHSLKFFLPGGASFQWLIDTDEHLDALYDIDFVQQNLGTTLGSGAVMVFDDTTDPLLVAWRLAKFYAHESCGKCTPCREGTGWIEKVLYRMSHGQGRPEDLELLISVGSGISPNVATAPFTQTTLCPLGPSVVSPIASLDKYFRAEIMERLNANAGARVTTTEPKPEVTKETVTVTVDGQTFEAKKGELLIKAAQDHGVYIPRFCWHERMKPVGMCRMCLVEVEGVRGFPPACTMPVAEGMVCNTQSEAVKKIQDGVLEFLLVNHPLDCPVCDRGGECPLQDQTLAFGPGESRFIEEKRHFEKPIELSNLVLLDRERCIQCARCTRFADEIAGDPLIDFVDRGDRMQVLNFAEQPFDSYFSGNTVQICPVGALTARQYRFKARPWDLETVETSCNTCSVQCRGALQSSSNRLVRLLGVDSDPVNHGWLCDKGRYNIEWVHSERRLIEPVARINGELQQVSWPEALDTAAALIRDAIEEHGPESVALLGGARGTNEDGYALARLMKGVIGTDNVDAQIGDGLPAEVMLGLPRAQIADCDRAAAIVLLGPDLEEELPVLHLRVRRAAVELGVPIIDLAAAAHGLSEHTTVVERSMPGEKLPASALELIANARGDRPGPVVVVLGRSSLAESAAVVTHAAKALRDLPDVRFLSALRRGNVHGAIDSGLVPGFLPGRVSVDAGREWFEAAWGKAPSAKGLDAKGILEAAAAGKIEVLVINGSDPIADFPDADLARRGIAGVKKMIAIGAFVTGTSGHSEVALPCTLWGEKTGSMTNLEGRVQRVLRKVAPEGTAMDDWRIAGELALRLGVDFDFATVDEVTDELARVAPALDGVDTALLRRARDGVVLPLAEHRDEIVLRTRALSILADDGSGTSWDPIKVEGEVAADAELESPEPEAGDSESDGEVAAPEPAAAPAVAVPALWTWDGQVEDVEVPARDAYSLRLVVGRRLYDNGRMVSEAPALDRLRRPYPLRISPHDAAGLGVESGGEVRVTSTRSSQVMTIETDVRVPNGVAQLDFSADGAGAAALIDASSVFTDLRVETLR